MAIDPFFGSVLSAGTSLLGGLLGQESSRKANERAAEEAAHNRALQMKYAKLGVTWRAEDVMNAYQKTGIHPLALLGVSGPTFSPVTTSFMGGSPMGEGLARAGQDISRGLHATADRELRETALRFQEKAMQDAAVRGGLENELLRVRIASEAARLQQMTSPVMPSPVSNRWLVDGQNTELRAPVAQGRLWKDQPLKRDMADPAQPHQESAAVTSLGWLKNSDGSYTAAKSKDAQERLEDDFWGSTKHFITNTVVPMFDPRSAGVPFPAPAGHHWYIDWKGDRVLRRDAPTRLKGSGWRD